MPHQSAIPPFTQVCALPALSLRRYRAASPAFAWLLMASSGCCRRDASFDQLIAQIYPDLEGYEEQQDKQIALINKRMNFNNQFTRSSVQGAAQQDEARRGVRNACDAGV